MSEGHIGCVQYETTCFNESEIVRFIFASRFVSSRQSFEFVVRLLLGVCLFEFDKIIP